MYKHILNKIRWKKTHDNHNHFCNWLYVFINNYNKLLLHILWSLCLKQIRLWCCRDSLTFNTGILTPNTTHLRHISPSRATGFLRSNRPNHLEQHPGSLGETSPLLGPTQDSNFSRHLNQPGKLTVVWSMKLSCLRVPSTVHETQCTPKMLFIFSLCLNGGAAEFWWKMTTAVMMVCMQLWAQFRAVYVGYKQNVPPDLALLPSVNPS